MNVMRFDIVIVKKSLDAANAITAGKISSRATSIISVIIFRLVRPKPPPVSCANLRCDFTTDGKESFMPRADLHATLFRRASFKMETAPRRAGPF
jgi:hypothetical protein